MAETEFDLFSDTSAEYVSYGSITGELDTMTNSTGPSDQLGTKVVHLLVPRGKQASLTVDNLTVDDWGFVDIQAVQGTKWNNGAKMRLVDLTSDRESPGPRGGHVEWSDSSDAITLPAGKYDITVSQTNQPYNEEYNDVAHNNRSCCNATISISYADVSLKVVTADEYGEIPKTNTDCNGYIKSGDKIANGHHAISVGLEYSGPYPDKSFDGTPASSVTTDKFNPSSVSLQKDGKARFKVWTEANTGTPSEITLNGVTSDQVHYLPAVFEDLFEVTIYYTVRESGCTAKSDTTCIQSVYIGNTGRTASAKNLNQGFVSGVRSEGCGLLKTPFTDSATGDEYPYISYDYSKKTWTYRKYPVGNKENEITKGSCAGCTKDLKNGSQIQLLLSDALTKAFGGNVFTMADVGENIKYHHIDLYWGEDDPLRGDTSLGIPQGLNCTLPEGTIIRGILVSE